jgi:hypothetical protein
MAPDCFLAAGRLDAFETAVVVFFLAVGFAAFLTLFVVPRRAFAFDRLALVLPADRFAI